VAKRVILVPNVPKKIAVEKFARWYSLMMMPVNVGASTSVELEQPTYCRPRFGTWRSLPVSTEVEDLLSSVVSDVCNNAVGDQVLPSLEQTVLLSDRSSLDSVPPVEHTVPVEDAPPSRSSCLSRSKASGVCSKRTRSLSIPKPRSQSRSPLRKACQLAWSSSSLSGSSSESEEHPNISFESESTSHVAGSAQMMTLPAIFCYVLWNWFIWWSSNPIFSKPSLSHAREG
jgi:hypothetical protein